MDRTPDRADPTEHPGLDVLADAAEGLLDDRTARAVDDHLAHCAACREQATALSDVSRALAALPDPPAPPDLTERIDLAVANEQASARSTSEQPTLTVLASGKRRGDRGRVLATAATVAALVAGIGYASFHTTSEGGGGASGSGGGGADAVAPSRVAAAPVVHHSGANYTQQSLKAAVPSLVQEAAVAASGNGRTTTSGSRTDAHGTPDRAAVDRELSTCSRNLGQSPGRLAAVDYARFDSASQIIMLFRTDAPDRVRVYVVPPDCAAKGASLIPTTVLNDVPVSASPSP